MGAAPAQKLGPCLAGDQQDEVHVDADELPVYIPHPKESGVLRAWHLMAKAASRGRCSYTGHTENAQEGALGICLFVPIAQNPAGSGGNSEFCAHKGSFILLLDEHSQLRGLAGLGSLW